LKTPSSRATCTFDQPVGQTDLPARLMEKLRRAWDNPNANSPEVAKARADAEEQLRNRRPSLEARLRHYRSCGVPLKIIQAYQQGLDARPGEAALREWMAGRKLFAILRGQFGSGKSTTSAVVLELALRKVEWSYHRDAPDSFWVEEFNPRAGLWITAEQLAASWTEFPDGEGRATWDKARRVRILVLDDLGREPNTEKSNARLANLLCERDAELRRTVFSTTLTTAQLKERYGDALADRLAQEAENIGFGNVSLRRDPRGLRAVPGGAK